MKEVEANKRIEKKELNVNPLSMQCCGFCKKIGHNVRTCQKDV